LLGLILRNLNFTKINPNKNPTNPKNPNSSHLKHKMKKIYLIALLSIICNFSNAQISRVDSASIVIHFPIGLESNRLSTITALRSAYQVQVEDSLPRLQMQLWRFPNQAKRQAFMQIWGDYAGILEQSVLRESAPKKPRMYRSNDSTSVASATYWEQSFLGNCPQAGNTPVKVAIIDGGVCTNQGNLPQNALLNRHFDAAGSRNFTREGTTAMIQDNNDYAHGTRVASVIAQIYDRTGMPATQKITIFKAFNAQGEAELWDVLKGIDACIQQRMNIVNLSFNYAAHLPPQQGATRAKLLLEIAMNIAKDYNMLFVTSAGNDNVNVDNNPNIGYFPTNFEGDPIVKVAADSLGTQPTFFSNYGSNSVDVAAPGTVTSVGRNDTLMVSSGTSFAAPIVAAILAVEASQLSSFDWWAVRQKLNRRFKTTIPTAWQGKLKVTGGVLKPICQ
jgi:hypothetical protein